MPMADGSDALRQSKCMSISDDLNVGISATSEDTLPAMMWGTTPPLPRGHAAARMLGPNCKQRLAKVNTLRVHSKLGHEIDVFFVIGLIITMHKTKI